MAAEVRDLTACIVDRRAGSAAPGLLTCGRCGAAGLRWAVAHTPMGPRHVLAHANAAGALVHHVSCVEQEEQGDGR